MQKALKNNILFVATILYSVVYMLWRVLRTLPYGYGFFPMLCAFILFMVEIIGFFEMIIHYYGLKDIEVPQKPEIDEDLYPDVDVFVATYNEPQSLLRKTLNGCLNMDYPQKSRVHIYLCDDGNRTQMKQLAQKLGVNYLARDDLKGAKAGNLNNAMANSSSPLIVTLDADMIPMHDFLVATVPYFLKNEQAKKHGEAQEHADIGFIQTPQSFYNTDLFQFNLYSENRIPNEQDYFYRDIQVSKNKTNSVIYGGSNTVLSRKALEDVGGFFTNSITEDFATGILIQSKGYRCYAVDEIHASGLSPTDLKSLIKQRERWARGCIQTGRRLNILFRKGLTLGQRLSYISSISYWYAAIKRFVYIMAPILFAVFNIIIVKCTLPELLVFWLPMYLLNDATLKRLSGNIRNTRWTNVYETIMFNALMPAVILETFGISKNSFSVTKKDNIQETNPYKLMNALPYFIYIILSVVGIWNMIYSIFDTGTLVYSVVLFWLTGNLFSLLMAVFFMLGRQQFRKSERYAADVCCRIKFKNMELESRTLDISETGFSFSLDNPEFIDPEDEIEVLLETDRYRADMICSIVTAGKFQKVWKYAVKITHISEQDLDQWICIVHDRIPTLPARIEKHLGFFDDLQVNIRRRTEKKMTFSRKYPRVVLNKEVKISEHETVTVTDFNYSHILLKNPQEGNLKKEITLHIADDIVLKCTLSQDHNHKEGILYRIDNIDDIVAVKERRGRLLVWLDEASSMLYDESSEGLKKEEANLELNLMDYI
ncbi:MAG: glycosyltransferase [Proteocatella sp.]